MWLWGWQEWWARASGGVEPLVLLLLQVWLVSCAACVRGSWEGGMAVECVQLCICVNARSCCMQR